MAAIEKIRRHSGLLIGIVGFALLVFVLEALLESRGRTSTGPSIAVVDGEKINVSDYDQLKEKRLEQVKVSMGNTTLPSSETYRVYNSTLEEMIRKIIMTKEYEAAGIDVTIPDELRDQMTDHPHNWAVQFANNYLGGFSKEQMESYFEQLPDIRENNPRFYEYWLELENGILENRLESKYNNLVMASYFLPTPLAQKYYENKNTKVSADVIALRYATIQDSTVTVTDADKKAFYEENKYRYKTEETRDIEYVIFDILPSDEDRQAVLKTVMDLKPDFEATEDAVKFVNANSDRHYDSTWLARKNVPQLLEQPIFDGGQGVGYVFGPYEDGDSYNLVRIVDMQNRPDSLRASHILIGYNGAYGSKDTITKKEAEDKANEILAQLKAAKNKEEKFAEFASQYNKDATKDKGGDLDWFTDGAMIPEFNEYVINNDKNSLGVVETVYGYHVVMVTGKTAPQPKVRLAYLTHEIVPSSRTYQNVFNKAHKFVTENKTAEQFNKAVEEQGLTKRSRQKMTKSTYQIPGIENPRELVRWAFDSKTKKGEVSERIFELDNMYVVAVLTGVVHEGYEPMDVVLEEAKYQLINKKKGEVAVEKMKACGNDEGRMVSELHAEAVPVPNITIDSKMLGNFGTEADIIGTLMGMKEGEELGPIAGNTSAFIIKNVKITQPAPTTDYSDIISEKTTQYTNKVNSGAVYNALKDKTKIKDKRTDVF